MNKVIMIVIAALVLVACKEDKGLHTGAVLQDCAAIEPNQRQDAALAIKGLSREDSISVLVVKFNTNVVEAEACLK